MYKFAIIGCGRIAVRHAENISAIGILVAVCDINKEKADSFGSLYQANAYNKIEDLLKSEPELDIVVVCTPNGLHAEHAIKSLQAGRHVLCEKPLCLTTVAGRQMIDTAYFFKRKLFVVKQNRYNEPVKVVKNEISNGNLGKILSFQVNCFWNRPQEYYTGDWKGSLLLDGGILYTQFSHFIDILYWLLGDVEEVKGFKGNMLRRRFMEIEDNGVAVLHMKSGAIGTINYTINAINKNLEGSISIFGEKASVKIGGQYLNTLEWYESNHTRNIKIENGTLPNDYGLYKGSMSNHDKVYNDIINALEGNSSLVEASEAVKTIEIIEKIYAATNVV